VLFLDSFLVLFIVSVFVNSMDLCGLKWIIIIIIIVIIIRIVIKQLTSNRDRSQCDRFVLNIHLGYLGNLGTDFSGIDQASLFHLILILLSFTLFSFMLIFVSFDL